MTKTKTFITVAVLLACVSVFGAWTGASVTEIRYADAPLIATYATETISYTRKETVGPVNTAGGCPYYYPLSSLPNSCGAVAGAEIISYYDKYFPSLIPNWTSHYTSGTYRDQDTTYVPALMNELYTLMRTNVNGVGVSKMDFLNGMISYINSNGHQVVFQSVTSGNKVNYKQCKTAINNNKLVVIFTQPTQVYSISSSGNTDVINTTNIAGSHIMVAFGYYEVDYYNNSDTMFRSDAYLNVAVGKSGYGSMLFQSTCADVEGAYVVNIQ